MAQWYTWLRAVLRAVVVFSCFSVRAGGKGLGEVVVVVGADAGAGGGGCLDDLEPGRLDGLADLVDVEVEVEVDRDRLVRAGRWGDGEEDVGWDDTCCSVCDSFVPDDLVELRGEEEGEVEVAATAAVSSACLVWLAGGLSSAGSGRGGTVSLGGAVWVWTVDIGACDKGVGARGAQQTPMESENIPCPCRGVPNLIGVPSFMGVPSYPYQRSALWAM